jgi:hypothetical protein
MSDSCTDERIRVKYWKKNVSILFQEWFWTVQSLTMKVNQCLDWTTL